MTARVLIVDDNEDLAEDLRELFEQMGRRVVTALDAEAAVAAAEADPFDLALVDVRLSAGDSGLDLLPRLRAASPEGEVVVVTGTATLHSAIDAVRLGVFAYVPKPFDPLDLLRIAERALAQVALRAERTALARDLAGSESLHRAVFDTVESLIVGLDDAHRIRLWNRAAARATGWEAAETIGQTGSVFLFEEPDRGALEGLIAAARAGHRGELRLPLRTRASAPRIVRWQVRPLVLGDAASAELVLLAGDDLTERLELERRAADAEAMAAMGRLTSALAHEIRNPLNAASLQLELIRRSSRRIEHEEIERRSDVVSMELARLTALLDDFLGLARPKHLTLDGVDAERVLRQVYALHEPSATEAGVELSIDIVGVLPSLRGDEARLKQALVNLVVNALEATRPQGGSVVLRGALEDGAIVLAVEDDGPGLPVGPRVREPFETTKPGGTGLGLPIVERIAQMHGGVLELADRAGGGTRAALRIPCGGPASTR